MVMKIDDLYLGAHLFVAAVRILQHQKNAPPSIEAVSQTLAVSLEQGHFLARELQSRNIIEVVEGSFGTRIFIKDHLAVEKIPRDTQGSRLEDELKRFQNKKPDYRQKIASMRSQKERKQKDLFAELEKKLKHNLDPP